MVLSLVFPSQVSGPYHSCVPDLPVKVRKFYFRAASSSAGQGSKRPAPREFLSGSARQEGLTYGQWFQSDRIALEFIELMLAYGKCNREDRAFGPAPQSDDTHLTSPLLGSVADTPDDLVKSSDLVES
jgi:hypothetical protein